MKILRYVLPSVLLALAILNAFVPVPYFYQEMGLIENFTVLFLLAALAIVLFQGLRNFNSLAPRDRLLMLMLAAGTIYFAGEELSWGQHFVGFKTPEGIAEENYQHEMNFHNHHGFAGMMFDKLPRQILTIGILLGGVIFPLLRHRLPVWIQRYLLGRPAIFVGLLCVLVSVPNKVMKSPESNGRRAHRTDERSKLRRASYDGGELKEMYIALFILLFTIHFAHLLKTERESGNIPADPSAGA